MPSVPLDFRACFWRSSLSKPEEFEAARMHVPPVDPRTPTSTVLRDLLLQAPSETVTLGWLMAGLRDRSFGIVLLLLGLLASLPGASAIVGVVIVYPAGQMVLARSGPVLPRFVAARTFQKRRLGSTLNRIVPLLQYLERFIRPRWHAPFEVTKRVVGAAVLFLGVLLFTPVPLSNLPPALVIVLLSFAYLEEDGVLLCIALTIAVAVILVAAGAAWQAMSVAGWVGGLF